MLGYQLRITSAMVCAITMSLAACNQKSSAPELQTTDSAQIQGEEPITVIGCLKSGALADDTFVLTASRAEGASATSTYELSAPPNVNLREYVGQQVEVSGMLRSVQKITSRGDAVTDERTKGTSGTPVVQTKSELEVKRVAVNSVKPAGAACQE
jgi:hypothetical protein